MAYYATPKNQYGFSVASVDQMKSFQEVLNLGSKLAELSLGSLYQSGRGEVTAENIGKTQLQNIATEAALSGVNLTVHAPWMLDITQVSPILQNPQSPKTAIDQYREILNREEQAAIKFADELAKAANQKGISVVVHSSNAPAPTPQEAIFVDKQTNFIYGVSEDYAHFYMSKQDFEKLYPDIVKALKDKGVYDKAIKEDKNGVTLSIDTANIWFPILQKDRLKQEITNLKIEEERLLNQRAELSKINAELIPSPYKIETLTAQDLDARIREIQSRLIELENNYNNFDKNLVSINDFAKEQAAKNVAEMALYSAFNTTTRPQILVENTERGDFLLSNPEDVAKVIDEARKIFVEEATKKGMSKKDAEELAKQIIAMNLDIGHLNLLRNITNPKTGKPYTEKELVDIATSVKDYIAKYHFADNLGYTDAHLPIGEGNAPIKEIYEKLKSLGVEAPAVLEVFGKEGITMGAELSSDFLGKEYGVKKEDIYGLPYSNYSISPINENFYSTYTSSILPGLLPSEPNISYYLPPF